MTPARVHLTSQTRISIAITMAISAGFFLLVFRFMAPVQVWQPDYWALDFLPQSIIASFMAGLMPALQTRSAILKGDLAGSPPSVRSIVLRAAVFAVLGLVLAGLVIALLSISGAMTFPWATALAIKMLYGGFLGLLITPLALRAILDKG